MSFEIKLFRLRCATSYKTAICLHLSESIWFEKKYKVEDAYSLDTHPFRSFTFIVPAWFRFSFSFEKVEEEYCLSLTHQSQCIYHSIQFDTNSHLIAERKWLKRFVYIVRHCFIGRTQKKKCLQSSGIVDASEWPSKRTWQTHKKMDRKKIYKFSSRLSSYRPGASIAHCAL